MAPKHIQKNLATTNTKIKNMKNTLKIFAILIFLANNSCKGQQMVQTPNDAHKLRTNEQLFINKPLKNLLKEIKPEIKMADATRDFPDYFSFKFIDPEHFKNGRAIGKNYIRVYVYVKEQIDWHYEKRSKGKELVWTKEDAEKYGNLTVIRIKVSGNE
jgi:hypothetical protein